MCSTATASLIQEVAQEFVQQDRAFTAFEVSLEVQKRQKANGEAVERHRNIKNDIHRTLQGYVDSGVYLKSLQDVGAPTQAFLYYPPTYDPTQYQALSRNDSSAPVAAVVGSALSLPPVTSGIGLLSSADDDGDDGDLADKQGRTGDARGAVCIPTYILRAAQFSPGDVAFACADSRNGEAVLVLAKQLPAGLSKQTSYTVDPSNNIRVTTYTLNKAGLDGSNGYDFDVDGVNVVVKAHKVSVAAN